jgi:hypothetical protein
LCAVTAFAQAVVVPNASFEAGGDAPEGWTLSGGEGRWLADAADGKHAIAVSGDGIPGTTNYWRSGSLSLEPSSEYRVQFFARQLEGGGGCPISGPVFCNRDLWDLSKEWTEFSSVFVTPSVMEPSDAWLRFGQWEVNGSVAYDAVRVVRVQSVYRARNGVVLGEGESIEGNHYVFTAPLDTSSFNQSRPLERHRCYFNSTRWVFGAGSEVVYRHRVGRLRQLSGRVEINVGYYTGGELVVETGIDGATWRETGVLSSVGVGAFDVPGDLLPSAEVWLRLSARRAAQLGQNSDVGAINVFGYEYEATLDAAPGDMRGGTQFVAVPESDTRTRVRVAVETFGEGVPGGDNTVVVRVENVSQETLHLRPTVTVTPDDGKPMRNTTDLSLEPGVHEVRMAYEVNATGRVRVAFDLGKEVGFRAETSFEVAGLYDSSYGEVLPESTRAVGLWWASSGWKISQTRPLPAAKGRALRIQAARNEVEAAQVVVRPTAALTGFAVAVEPLIGPKGVVIPAKNVETLRVRYVPVVRPTDKIGAAAPWPDPLPPFKGLIDLEGRRNQPIWVRVKVPENVPSGTYKGVIRLSASGYEASVPIEVTVFDFELPDRMTCTTAFGMSPGNILRYHGLSSARDQRRVMDLYLADYGAHHISPYNPAPLDEFRVTWPGLGGWQGGTRDRADKHAGEGALLLADEDPNSSVSASNDKKYPIPDRELRIGFWHKTAQPGHPFCVTVSHYDADGQWMSGKNNTIQVKGNGKWSYFERLIRDFPEGACQFSITLWSVVYAEDGTTVGTVRYDDLVVEDAASHEPLMVEGFEPLGEAALTPQFDWTAWDQAMDKAFSVYHFNSVDISIPGMGGGTFHSRTEPSLLGYGEDTPEYKTAFTAYCRAVETHLREKGWLKDAYVYWFDEPDPKDYEFVMNGFRKLKEAAPGVGRMLTEQVEPELVGGPNIWCPVTPAFDLEPAKERQSVGDRFWWYVCTGPKAPFTTLFIDHPGTELRVWLWQTWQRRIQGILIWETTYWTSNCAYPDPEHPQNPYEDPMGWVSGYSTPAGVKQPWGNGDGRFVYPPEAGANAHPEAPVLEGPVDSIRWEMLRDGIEDYEYMAILERLIQERGKVLSMRARGRYLSLLEVPEDITKDMKRFTTDPEPIEKRREAVARAIERLCRL